RADLRSGRPRRPWPDSGATLGDWPKPREWSACGDHTRFSSPGARRVPRRCTSEQSVAPSPHIHEMDRSCADAVSGIASRTSSSGPAFCSAILECLLPLRNPEHPRVFALIALELVGDPEQCAVDHGAVVAGQFDNPGLDDETAKFNEVPRPLASLDLPRAHVMPRPCRLMAVAYRPVAPERCQCRGQLPVHFAATV